MRYDPELRVRSLPERINPATTALVIVDMQNDFAVPTGACEQSGDDVSSIVQMTKRLKGLLAAAREQQILTIHVRMNNDRPYVAANLAETFARRGLGYGPCRSDTEGEKFVDGMQPELSEREFLVTKHRFSGFWGTEIDLLLRSNGIKTLVLTGIATEVCVESTARDAFFRDYSVVIAGDCTSSFSQQRQEASHTLFDRSFGVVETAATIVDVWRQSNETDRGWQRAHKDSTLLGTLEQRVSPQHAALVLIGLQQSACAPTPFAEPDSAQSCSVVRLLEAARKSGAMIIHVASDYAERSRNLGAPMDSTQRTASALEFATGSMPMPMPPARTAGKDEFLAAFRPRVGEPVVWKHRFDAFQDTDLELLLRANDIRTAIIAGQATDRCVDSTARSAAMRDFYAIVPEDAVATNHGNETRHRNALDSLQAYFALIPSSSRVIAAWT
jgi:ureidoacrylate peracid hydrolase